MYNDLEWVSEGEWDPYAWFGFAIAEAQAVERQLLFIALAVTNEGMQSRGRKDSWSDIYDKLGRWTLGKLTAHLERHGVLAKDIVEMFKRAVMTRNQA